MSIYMSIYNISIYNISIYNIIHIILYIFYYTYNIICI